MVGARGETWARHAMVSVPSADAPVAEGGVVRAKLVRKGREEHNAARAHHSAPISDDGRGRDGAARHRRRCAQPRVEVALSGQPALLVQGAAARHGADQHAKVGGALGPARHARLSKYDAREGVLVERVPAHEARLGGGALHSQTVSGSHGARRNTWRNSRVEGWRGWNEAELGELVDVLSCCRSDAWSVGVSRLVLWLRHHVARELDHTLLARGQSDHPWCA
jgi:hypothetical protein